MTPDEDRDCDPSGESDREVRALRAEIVRLEAQLDQLAASVREQAAESLTHATLAGEEVTSLGQLVSLGIGDLVGSHHSTVDEMMQEMLVHDPELVNRFIADNPAIFTAISRYALPDGSTATLYRVSKQVSESIFPAPP